MRRQEIEGLEVINCDCRDYIHAVLLWTELQPPATVLLIFVLLYTLVSLPVVWGYIVINLACGYLYGVAHGIAVTVLTATIGVAIAHVLCKVISVTYQPVTVITSLYAAACAVAPHHDLFAPVGAHPLPARRHHGPAGLQAGASRQAHTHPIRAPERSLLGLKVNRVNI